MFLGFQFYHSLLPITVIRTAYLNAVWCTEQEQLFQMIYDNADHVLLAVQNILEEINRVPNAALNSSSRQELEKSLNTAKIEAEYAKQMAFTAVKLQIEEAANITLEKLKNCECLASVMAEAARQVTFASDRTLPAAKTAGKNWKNFRNNPNDAMGNAIETAANNLKRSVDVLNMAVKNTANQIAKCINELPYDSTGASTIDLPPISSNDSATVRSVKEIATKVADKVGNAANAIFQAASAAPQYLHDTSGMVPMEIKILEQLNQSIGPANVKAKKAQDLGYTAQTAVKGASNCISTAKTLEKLHKCESLVSKAVNLTRDLENATIEMIAAIEIAWMHWQKNWTKYSWMNSDTERPLGRAAFDATYDAYKEIPSLNLYTDKLQTLFANRMDAVLSPSPPKEENSANGIGTGFILLVVPAWVILYTFWPQLFLDWRFKEGRGTTRYRTFT